MPKRDNQTCEVKVEGAWRPASVEEAKGVYALAPKRCPTCHGAVMLYGMLTPGVRQSFAHRVVHTGCPRDPKRFSGTPSLHPKALT